jgi:rod shape-determining protein MreD
VRFLKYLLLFYVLLILQVTLAPVLSILGMQPDLIFLLLILICYREGPAAGLGAGFAIGLLQDAYNPAHLGENALVKTVLGYLAGWLDERIMRIDPGIRVLLAGAAYLLHEVLYYVLAHQISFAGFGHFAWRYMLGNILYTMAVAGAYTLVSQRFFPQRN